MLIKILASIAIIGVCVFLFIFTYLLNKRTPKPEGCEDISENCEGCNVMTCSHRTNKEDK